MRLGVEAALVGCELLPGDVEVAEGRVVRVGVASGNGRGIAAPGFIDLQVNGFAGVDLLGADVDGYERVSDALLETGVTSYLATFITSPESELVRALNAAGAWLESGAKRAGARVLGVHLEGPFLAPSRLGTHPPGSRRDPDLDLTARLLAAGPVRLMTLAPELPGARELSTALRGRGVIVSYGHTDATAAQAHAGFDAGAETVTHLFNAMRPIHHREPGIAGVALARDDVIVQLIADGVHLSDDTIRLVSRAARGRIALVTDAIAGAGLGDGRHRLGGVDVEIQDGIARGPQGQLAGSTLTMIDALRHFHASGVPLAEALYAATGAPARVLHDPTLALLRPGARADIVVLADDLAIERVLVEGEERVAY